MTSSLHSGCYFCVRIVVVVAVVFVVAAAAVVVVAAVGAIRVFVRASVSVSVVSNFQSSVSV